MIEGRLRELAGGGGTDAGGAPRGGAGGDARAGSGATVFGLESVGGVATTATAPGNSASAMYDCPGSPRGAMTTNTNQAPISAPPTVAKMAAVRRRRCSS